MKDKIDATLILVLFVTLKLEGYFPRFANGVWEE